MKKRQSDTTESTDRVPEAVGLSADGESASSKKSQDACRKKCCSSDGNVGAKSGSGSAGQGPRCSSGDVSSPSEKKALEDTCCGPLPLTLSGTDLPAAKCEMEQKKDDKCCSAKAESSCCSPRPVDNSAKISCCIGNKVVEQEPTVVEERKSSCCNPGGIDKKPNKSCCSGNDAVDQKTPKVQERQEPCCSPRKLDKVVRASCCTTGEQKSPPKKSGFQDSCCDDQQDGSVISAIPEPTSTLRRRKPAPCCDSKLYSI